MRGDKDAVGRKSRLAKNEKEDPKFGVRHDEMKSKRDRVIAMFFSLINLLTMFTSQSSSPKLHLTFGAYKADPDDNNDSAFCTSIREKCAAVSKLTDRAKVNDGKGAIDLNSKEIDEKLGKLKNPKVKKMDTLVFSADTVKARLRDIGFDLYPISLDKSIIDVTVSRQFLTHLYGGNVQETFPKIRKEMLDKHGMNDFMFPNLMYNPHAPEVPGAPGLFFKVIPMKPMTARVITRLSSGIWQYQGQYEIKRAPSLTKEEWLSQDIKVRRTWGNHIYSKTWGRGVRARISLRRQLGHEPTVNELNEALDSAIQFKDTSPEQIMASFDRGDEILMAFTMRCIGYDVDFQKNLAEKWPFWLSGQLKRDQRLEKATTSAKTINSTRKRKRQHGEYESDSGDPIEKFDTGESEEEVELQLLGRGTSMRPIIL